MKAFTISAISAALLAASSIAGATPVEVAAGSSLTRNFDLGAMGANPAPTYSKLWMDFGIVKSTVFNDGQIDYGDVYVYGDWNATGAVITGGVVQDTMYLAGWNDTDPDFVDGTYSIVYSASKGAFSVDDALYRYFAEVCDAAGQCNVVQISFPGAATQVPEPAPLGLLVLGLAGLALSRRRHVAHRVPRYW